MKGYMGALQANKIKPDPHLIYTGNISIESGKTGAEYFLSLSDPPDAIFAAEDFTALGAISKLKERNIMIPAQMGIIGFANELFGEHITPSLSTVDQQTIRMGKSALNLLVDIMEKKEQHLQQKVVLDPLLIVRQSSLRNGHAKK
jgi:LacI family transcriptional regulator